MKDNAELLNKSLKKQKKEKLKKKKDWEGRVQAQEKQKEDRQKKRKENINKKKTEKKEHKMKLNAKKGRFAVTVWTTGLVLRVRDVSKFCIKKYTDMPYESHV